MREFTVKEYAAKERVHEQPVRRGRPVVVPNSKPLARRNSPDSSNSSVGNGPAPTRVV